MKTKYLFILIIGAVSISCSDEEIKDTSDLDPEIVIEDCVEAAYGEDFTLSLGESVCFPNFNLITFKDSKHHLCPCIVECDYEGDILIELYTVSSEGIAVNNDDKAFYLKEVFKDPEILYLYDITSFSYAYGTDDNDIPACESDFEKEKMKITLTIERQ